MSNINVEALERAIAVSEALDDVTASRDSLISSCKRIVRQSREVQPCPSCGVRYEGAHYCIGKGGNNKLTFFGHNSNCDCTKCASWPWKGVDTSKIGAW